MIVQERRESGRRSATDAIALSRVTKRYSSVIALEELDLTVAQGEFLTLLGPSGCGKTTTLRIIGGFEQPDSGEVHIDGEPMQDRPPFRRPVNTVFQHYALFPHISVGDNVGYGIKMAGRPKDEVRSTVAQMLDLVQLKGVENRKPRELSGGQQQRVALARALAMQPKVLLLDEPLGSLDYKLRKEMQIELKEIHRAVGTSFVYVTHDQEEALAMSDRICVMSRGQVVQQGAPDTIYDSPESLFVASFVGDMNFLPGRAVSIHGRSAVVAVEGVGKIHADRVNGDLQVGDTVTVGIRPEDVRVETERPTDQPNAFVGRCIDQLVVGRTALAVVDHGSVRLKAELPRHLRTDQRGEVWTVCSPSRVFVFRETLP